MDHINIRVNQAYPEKDFQTDAGAIPQTIRHQAMHAKDVEPHDFKKKMMERKALVTMLWLLM
eukprot:10885811-Karenia_brevis.AAC.1